ncbi:hypothetical protein IQ06DRAFT_365190 [Phaeosphaeriaceae sp. SRC1lsM3a]|nr:hypothetical protein IQ06DRAFT_365190 [Stagonospora sp. SRC1lsM3a]
MEQLRSMPEDQYFRLQIRRAREHREIHSPASSWLQQVQQAAAVNQQSPYSQQNNGTGWSHQQQSQHALPFRQSHAPSYIQHLGQRQNLHGPQASSGIVNSGTGMSASNSVDIRHMHQHTKPTTSTSDFNRAQWQSTMPNKFQTPALPLDPQQPVQHFPVQRPSADYRQSSMSSNAIPMADIAHLRDRDWSNAAEQRARDFRLLGIPSMNLHQGQNPQFANTYQPRSIYRGPETSVQPSSTSSIPFSNEIMAQPPAHTVFSEVRQAQVHGFQDAEMQDRPGRGLSELVNHPGFSNV